MANICSNTFYAYSENPDNIAYIIKYFEDNWEGSDIDQTDTESVDILFDSKWDFPEEFMDELFEGIIDKDDIYMRCLSVEYGNDYVAYHKCEGRDGWELI